MFSQERMDIKEICMCIYILKFSFFVFFFLLSGKSHEAHWKTTAAVYKPHYFYPLGENLLQVFRGCHEPRAPSDLSHFSSPFLLFLVFLSPFLSFLFSPPFFEFLLITSFCVAVCWLMHWHFLTLVFFCCFFLFMKKKKKCKKKIYKLPRKKKKNFNTNLSEVRWCWCAD